MHKNLGPIFRTEKINEGFITRNMLIFPKLLNLDEGMETLLYSQKRFSELVFCYIQLQQSLFTRREHTVSSPSGKRLRVTRGFPSVDKRMIVRRPA